jgi:hypothetical protein
MPSQPWEGYIRALIYPVQFDADPRDGLDRVFESVIAPRALGAGPAEYLEAVRSALASETRLSELLPQDHDEATIRTYLAAVAERLEREMESPLSPKT